jgi:molybdopterin synthase catalytic subunit
MDYLKSDAPFWKKELTQEGAEWVEAKQTDQDRKDRWNDS